MPDSSQRQNRRHLDEFRYSIRANIEHVVSAIDHLLSDHADEFATESQTGLHNARHDLQRAAVSADRALEPSANLADAEPPAILRLAQDIADAAPLQDDDGAPA